MKKDFLKSLFKKKKVDWDSDEYKKKALNLLIEISKFDLYQDESQDKKEFEERFKKLLED